LYATYRRAVLSSNEVEVGTVMVGSDFGVFSGGKKMVLPFWSAEATTWSVFAGTFWFVQFVTAATAKS